MHRREPSADHREVLDRRLALIAGATVPRPGGEEWWWAHTHPRPDPRDLEPVEPAPLPGPGRHASRRAGESVAGALGRAVPAPLRGRVRLGAPQLTVVAMLIACGLALAAWQVARSEPQRLSPVSAEMSPAPAPDGPAPPDVAGAADSEMVTVDVAGRVRRPGIVVLPAGSRVVDALREAGGARHGVDTTSLNLARPLVDGEQVLVGRAPAGVPAAPLLDGTTPGGLVNLNVADQSALEALPEIGPVTALCKPEHSWPRPTRYCL